MTATLTIPLQAAIEIATANGWTYTEGDEINYAMVTRDGVQYIADADTPNTMAGCLQDIFGEGGAGPLPLQIEVIA